MADDDAAILALNRQVQSLANRLAALESVVQVSPAGITIQTAGNLDIVVEGRIRLTTAAGLDITAGGLASLTAGTRLSVSAGAQVSITSGGSTAITSAGDLAVTVNRNVALTSIADTAISAKDITIATTKDLNLSARDSLMAKVGLAEVSAKKDGTVIIKGKDITLDGSGVITAKAAKDVVMKGAKIRQN
jgi:type VI secretion system secreted protein VgrG